MIASAGVSVLIGTFVASSVEVTEMVIIVVGVGATRGWRSTWFGVGAGLILLIGIIAGLGQALRLIPIDIVRVIIGGLLLTFGLQWYREGVIGVAADGFSGGTEEEGADDGGAAGGGIDWTAFVLAFKGVLLEGLEVAFIVVAFGAGGGGHGGGLHSGSYGAAYVGAGAAFLVIGVIGLIAKRQLERVPGRTLKFGVGGLLCTFGTFWSLEGLGVNWPGGDLSLAWLYALLLASTFAIMYAVRTGMLGPVPPSAIHDPGPAGPSGLAPASETSIRDFQSAHGLAADGLVGRRTQAAVRAVRAERGAGRASGERGAARTVARTGVDAADREAILALQERLDLSETGTIDAETRGAIRTLQHPGIVEPLDTAAVADFQQEHDLPASGDLDEATRVALAAVLADSVAGARPPRAGEVHEALDPVRCLRELDPADSRSVCRFQKSLAIPASGDIDAETRGAMRALRAWLVVDPLDGGAVRDLQRRHGLAADGVVGDRTREALMQARRVAAASRPAPVGSESDAFGADSVAQFQRRHDLIADGTIGARTRQAILWEREHHLSVDAAHGASARAFQRQHGLREDGIVGPQTQAAMRAVRSERERRRDGRSYQRSPPPDTTPRS